MSYQTTTQSPKLFIGIDIHKRSWQVQTATDLCWGKSFSTSPCALSLQKWVETNFPEHEVSCAYEAGCCGFEPARQFMNYGWRTIVFNPADIHRTGTTSYHKTDKIDAKLICKELKDERLTAIHIPSTQREELRMLFRRRTAIVRNFRRTKTQIKMQLLYLGIEIPPSFDTPKWTHKFCNWIRALKCYHITGEQVIESMMNEYDSTEALLRDTSVKRRAYCRKHYKKQYYLLRSVLGIGTIVASGILAELGDLNRFKSAKQLSAYLGFMPHIKQSADNSRTFGITPRANHITHSYFVEAAWQAIRLDPALQIYYRKHVYKNPKSAIIKVAHKLVNRTRAVIVTETPYEIGIVE